MCECSRARARVCVCVWGVCVGGGGEARVEEESAKDVQNCGLGLRGSG